MKKIVIAVVLVLITGVALHGEHDDVRVIVPVMHEGWNLLGFSLQPYVVSDSVVSSGYDAIMYAALDDRVWYFNPNGYVVADTFIMGEGFWLKSFVSAPLIQEGIRSSNRMHVLFSTSPMICMTSEIPAFSLLLSAIARPASSLFAKARARTTPPTSGEEITRLSLFANFFFISLIIGGAEKILSKGISKKP